MTRGGRKTYVLHEDDRIRVVRRTSNGRNDPAHIRIELAENEETTYGARVLRLSVDELFDLTEILDDLCDDIEDGLVFGDQQ